MKYLLNIIILLSIGLVYGQEKKSKADKLFEKLWYKEAAKLYEGELKKQTSKELLQKAGDAYFFNTDMENAKKWYETLIANYETEIDPEYYFRYAHSLLGSGEQKKAKKWLKKFSKTAKKGDNRIQNFSEKSFNYKNLDAIDNNFELHNISVNTKFSEFGVAYYKDELMYSSAVDSSNFHTRIYYWNEQPFLNLFKAKINSNKTDVTDHTLFSKTLNTKYHEATVAFSPDYKRIYFTRNNYQEKLERDENGTNHLTLYTANLETNEDGEDFWTNIKALPFNSVDYSVGHPTISNDGQKLYFVSDMPGSIGATDIFVVDIITNGDEVSFSKPKNLGPKINTPSREMFPFITKENLYFSSDGYIGFGGLDVYQSKINNDEFNSPKNLGDPLNSKLDDFNFIIKETNNTGFVCSNRKGGKGDDDIYAFSVSEFNTNCEQKLSGTIVNEISGESIANVAVKLFSEETLINETTSDINGNYKFDIVIDCNKNYIISTDKTGYAPKQKEFKTVNENGETNVNLGLETLNKLIVEENGLLKIKIGIIYFDLDKSYIRKNDAAIELNKVVLLMNEYPNMVIQIESHTDSRNTDKYNLNLSDRRAKSTKAYLISQGISEERIESAKGFGESQLINKCSNGVKCSETEHQLNRRSEFIIVKM